MCGILALTGDTYAADFDRALDTLASRGPDARGIWRDERGPVLLGHRRLSIIDPAGGGQPMTSADGRHTLSYNGELYNFRELREQLTARGCRFETSSDTEVLLHALIVWGKDALPRLDGMFAFALWDARERRLFAARDRLGIKPLYVSRQPNTLVLASTLSPFFELTGFPRKLDPIGLRDYLATQSVPAPRTLLRGVAAVEPAGYLAWSPDTQDLTQGRYWEVPGPTDNPLAADDFMEAADAALTESVRRQMVADVPLGAFLSGGIDSSLMVSYMSRAASKPIQTFSVRFEAKRGYDESTYARAVAEQLGSEHHEFDAAAIDADAFVRAIELLDQPLADPAYLPTLSLAQLTRRHVTVAISGDGGDELFAGYERFGRAADDFPGHPTLERLIRLGLLPASLLRRTLGGADRLLWDRVKLGPFPRTRKDMAGVLSPDTAAACRIDETYERWLSLAHQFARPINTDALIRADVWTYLSDNCLIKTDRASMAHSLEVRVPILGQPVADLALPQPASTKLAQGLKTPLKALAMRHLPEAVWGRPKHGFSVPLQAYFLGPWQKTITDLVQDCRTLAPFLNASGLARRWQMMKTGRGEARALYTLLVLLAWLRTHPLDT